VIRHWLRRLRGILGIGTLWGATGAVVGSVTSVLMNVVNGLPVLGTLLEFGLGAGGLGFALGSTLASYLALLERRRTVDDLTPWRAAGWGALAGGTVSLLVGLFFLGGLPLGVQFSMAYRLLVLVSGVGAYSALTAGLAAGTVALARRAPPEIAPGNQNLLESHPSER